MAIVETEALSRRFGAIVAVADVSLSVERGEIFGFLGPNGAGKSTTIKILSTLLRPSSGRATLAGFDVVRQPQRVREAIGLVFQDSSLDERLTGAENLLFHAMLYGVPRAVARPRMQELLRMVDLEARRNHLVRTYSGGMRRRLEIARGLLHRPQVLFLDEPTVGLDPQTRAAIWEHVRRLRAQEGVTVFMTTHYMDEAEHCDRIAIIDHGKIVALDSPAGLKRMVGGDIIRLQTTAADLAAKVSARFPDVAVSAAEGEVQIEVEGGSTFIPGLLAACGEGVQAISMRQPTLDDVFLKLTGRAIREEETSNLDRMRTHTRAFQRGPGR